MKLGGCKTQHTHGKRQRENVIFDLKMFALGFFCKPGETLEEKVHHFLCLEWDSFEIL